MGGIGNRESVNALLAVGDKRSSVKNLSCKRIENTGMLLVLSVGLNINSMSSDPYKAAFCILCVRPSSSSISVIFSAFSHIILALSSVISNLFVPG